MKKVRNVLYGIILIAIAAGLILSQLGIALPELIGLSVFKIIVLVGCIWGIVDGLLERELWKVAVGGGIGYYILQDPFKLPHINIWVLFLAIFLLGAGLSMVFGGKKKHHFEFTYGDETFKREDFETDEEYREAIKDAGRKEGANIFDNGEDTAYDDFLKGDIVFSHMTKYVNSRNFRGGELSTVFSGSKIFLDGAELRNNRAHFDIDVVFGNTDLYVPHDWNVIDNTSRVFAEKKDYTEVFKEGAPTLEIEGDVVFGGLNIHRV